MKKKLLIAMIPVLGMGALVGSGFSAWVFGNEASQTFNFNGAVTVEPATGDLTLDYTENDFSVTLDQGGKGNVDNAVGVTVSNLSTITFSLTTNDTTVIEADEPKYEAEIKWSFSLIDGSETGTTNVNTYLALTTDMSNLGVNDYAALTTTGGKVNGNNSINYTYLAGTWTFTITMPSQDKILNYVDKPSTYAEWQKMSNDLDGNNFNLAISIDARIVEIGA